MIAAGVDVGGTKIQAVTVCDGEVIGSCRRLTPQEGAAAVLAAVAESVRSALRSASATVSELAVVGVGIPGTVDGSTGSVANSPNLPGFRSEVPVELGKEVSVALGGVPVKVDNDVRAAIIGEHRRGAGLPYRNLLGVFVGTGVGGGLILGGTPYAGSGAAGEIGHTLVREGGRRCGCGLHGCLEAYAGRAGIQATAEKLQAQGRRTRLFTIMRKRGRDRLTSGVIARALAAHDRLAQELVDEAVWALGIALANVQNLLDLEAIIVGGGLGDRLGRPFVERVAEAAQPHLHLPERPPRFLPTALGDLAGAVGAAEVALAAVAPAAVAPTGRPR